LKIVAVSDIHGIPEGRKMLDSIIGTTSPDLLVICGDITTFGPASYAESLLFGLKAKCAAVPGNCDPEDVLRVIEKRSISLHGKRVAIDGIDFVGIGGAPCCSFTTPREMPEEEFGSTLSSMMVKRCVLVTHAPPLGTLDMTRSGKSLGSKAIADAVSRFMPRLVLSGHVHEARGVIEKEGTVFANPGPLKEKQVVMAEVTSDRVSASIIDISSKL
jgi:Icc-related predicted phosphoesterase